MIEFFVFLIFLEQIYAAQAPAQAPMTKTISSTTLTIAPTCDKNAETFKGVAYFTTTTPLVHQEALEFCENIGGSLPIFLNESDWDSYSAYK